MDLRDDAAGMVEEGLIDEGTLDEGPFGRYRDADVADLIDEYPLAWVTARGDAGATASLLPLVAVVDAGGRVAALIGHLARRNPLHAALAADGRATLLFTGPQAYIAPEQAGRRDWAPTWNYAQAVIQAEIALATEDTGPALDVLLDRTERGKDEPWRSDRLGERYDQMLRSIVGFRATVTGVRARFKLGQDERPDTLRAIVASHPDAALTRWMRRFNQARL